MGAADNVMKTIKVVENTCLNNEVTIEELDKNLRATVKMASDNEQKLDELSYIPLDMENVQDGVWTPAEVAQICINHQDDVDLAIKKIYERKFIPNETKNEGQDEKIEEAMSDYGSDIVESRILDSN